MWKVFLRRLCIVASLFLLLVLLLGCTSASAQERMYEITEAELTQLEENLSELSNVNEGQREKLWNLQELLKASETRLEASERNSRMLSVKLDWLSKELTAQTSSLENANRLLQEYEEEERRTKRRIERQRNIAYVLAAVAVIFTLSSSG
jgi:septal ring factor EnvC (AmiA/AmiB activator)